MPSIFKRKRTWLGLVLLLPFAFLAFVALKPPPPLPRASGERMNAVLYREYGSPDVLAYGPADRLVPGDRQVLVKVHAASANPLDWHLVRGRPYLMRLQAGLSKPHDPRVGTDLAGEVVAVGPGVTRVKVGDVVFGSGEGAFGEFALAREKNLATKPPGLSFAHAAALPVAGLTALQAVRDAGRARPGHSVLINGASGGVGTYAVQIAKAYGATVTGVCSTRNVELVRSLGADAVVDYKTTDFLTQPARYDVVIDNVGNRSLGELRSVLKPGGVVVRIGGGGPEDSTWGFNFVGDALASLWYSKVGDRRAEMMLARVGSADLATLARMAGAGQLRSVIDRTFPLSEAADALRYLETGRARGKVIIDVVNEAASAPSATDSATPTTAGPATGAATSAASTAGAPAAPVAVASPE